MVLMCDVDTLWSLARRGRWHGRQFNHLGLRRYHRRRGRVRNAEMLWMKNVVMHASLRDRLRSSLAVSPISSDRIEFLVFICFDKPRNGLAVLVPLLPTPCCHDAVTVRYRTILHRTGADSHRSDSAPSQAHKERFAVTSVFARERPPRRGFPTHGLSSLMQPRAPPIAQRCDYSTPLSCARLPIE